MIQCWCWLQWKRFQFLYLHKYIYINIYLDMRVMSYRERTDVNDIGIYKSGMDLCGGSLDAWTKFRTLDLKYQQNEPDFVQDSKPRWSNSRVLLCQLSMYGDYCMWEHSLIFGEDDHQIIQFLQKYFRKHGGKKKISDHKFYMCFSCFKKKDKSKTKTTKNNKRI